MTTTPAPARTDVAPSTKPKAGLNRRTIRRLGLGLTTGAVVWATSIYIFTTDPHGLHGRIGDLTGFAFQLGVFCLLTVQIKTRAIGTSRAARIGLRVESVILGLACIWSLAHGLLPTGMQNATWLAFLDLCWPLSMLGMAVIAVKLAFTGRWRGVLRWWPLIAESWAVVTVPTFLMFGTEVSRWIGGTHLLIGYATLGLLLALRPELVVPKN